jgi:hypothetical protein
MSECCAFVDGSGAAVFFGICDFSFSESVYFVDVTVTTVGFGDNSGFPNFSIPVFLLFISISLLSPDIFTIWRLSVAILLLSGLYSFAISAILLFCYSAILLFCYSAILLFCY